MKNIKKTIRFSEEEWECIQDNAAKKGMKDSDYIREMACYPNEDWMSKRAIVQWLGKVGSILDKQEIKELKLIKKIRKELDKLWEML